MFNYQLQLITLQVEKIFLDIFNPRFSGEIKSPKFNDDTKYNDQKAQELTRRYLLAKHVTRDTLKNPKVKDYIKPGIKTGCEYSGALL
jgi:hypothetical protein